MPFGIGEAVKEMRNGEAVRRAGWNGKEMWLALVPASSPSVFEHGALAAEISVILGMAEAPKPVAPFVVMKAATGELVPWLCSQTDLLATDWELVPVAERG